MAEPKLSYLVVDPPSSFGSIENVGHLMRQLRGWGYAGVELLLTHPLGVEVGALKRAAADAGIQVCSLLTGWSYFNEGFCLSSRDDRNREQAVGRLLGYVDVAAELGSILVFGQMQGFPKDEPDPVVANERIAAGLREVCARAERRGVTIVFEPVNHLQVGFNNTVAEVVEMCRRVGSPALVPMVDTVHLNIEERSITEPIHRVGRAIGHVHLCETNGSLLGSGHLDIPSVFRALAEVGYDRFISIKIYRGTPWHEAAPAAINHLRSLGLVR